MLNSLIVVMSILAMIGLTLFHRSAPRARFGPGYIIVVTTIIAGLMGCVHSPRLVRPETCSPSSEEITCKSASYRYNDEHPNPLDFKNAEGFVCYWPEEVEPFLERCGE